MTSRLVDHAASDIGEVVVDGEKLDGRCKALRHVHEDLVRHVEGSTIRKPMMKATIWFSVRLEAKIPMAM